MTNTFETKAHVHSTTPNNGERCVGLFIVEIMAYVFNVEARTSLR
ncbi:hypothetical protein BG10_2239 [Bacillus thuringiensis serovar morrisoni]|uniref:Uncharacterized protein n=1 Tax=Bacillus cereus HuB4-4 TaxID=1053211 RepID=A0A9W5QW66_BACCE|nr:hypothetical protein IGM_02448 [Bacillus cereus HuB4-4]KIP23561.1 hypothetical protein BG10_3586 [Bacillus thuringiensis serovar morrisoni]KIP29274.1 hypothetical protein BG10_2239 [Bacillus thuringiensis serovar morrisoni]